MRPTYPLTCALIEEEEPEQSVVVRRARNGRIRIYDLGEFSDQRATFTHFMIDRGTVEYVMDFWRANRNSLFNINTELGDQLVAAFAGKPQKVREQDHGPWYNLVVKLVLYDPAEGGL